MTAYLTSHSHGVPRTPEPPKKNEHANETEQLRKSKPGDDLTPPLPVDVHVKGEQTQAPPSEIRPHDSWSPRKV